MSATLYSRELLRWSAELYKWPINDDVLLRDTMRAEPCGSAVTIAIETEGQGTISRFGMDVKACAFGQASAAIMAHYIVGQSAQYINAMSEALSSLLAGADAMDSDGIYAKWPEFHLLSVAAPHSARHAAIMLPYKTILNLLNSRV